MGLFNKSKKKKEEKEQAKALPAPPKFPEMEEVKNAIKPRIEEPTMLPSPAIMPITSAVTKKPIEKPVAPIEAPITPFSAPPIQPAFQTPPITKPFISQPSREVTEEFGKTKVKEPIYVKIDQFKSALDSFEEIKQKLMNSFDLLDKIKETRAQEREEIVVWEKEIEEIKGKLSELDTKLFSKAKK